MMMFVSYRPYLPEGLVPSVVFTKTNSVFDSMRTFACICRQEIADGRAQSAGHRVSCVISPSSGSHLDHLDLIWIIWRSLNNIS